MQRKYSIKGREIALDVDENLVAVRFKDAISRSGRAKLATAGGDGASYGRRIELPGEKFTVLPASAAEARAPGGGVSARLAAEPNVERVAEVFQIGDKHAVTTDRVIVGLAGGDEGVAGLLAAHKLEMLERLGETEYLLRAAPSVDPLDLVEKLNADKRVDYAEPDFVTFGRHLARRPKALTPATAPTLRAPTRLAFGATDPLLPRQYAVFITEADKAWRLSRGAPGVRIAILDEGVDTDHPDLSHAVDGAYDAIENDAWQEPQPWDGHGTACAGLAAAVPDNGEGIAGIGGGCSLLAVRIAQSLAPGGSWVTSNHIIRRAIDWSVDNGADVLSNSWGGGAPSIAIENAFARARRIGRGGRGCVVVVAAGNDSGPVDFPGNLPGVLTVSASNEYDEFKTRSSGDGEYWWGSNFGPEVDLAAPGVHNLTTDIAGADGYGPDGYADFNGTSSATPIVAGACGLILSVNGDLREEEVRRILRETADQVGQFPYQGDRNDQMGHGRLNALAAVEEAARTLGS